MTNFWLTGVVGFSGIMESLVDKYCSSFQAADGYVNLTGIDYSEKALELARVVAEEKKFNIKYKVSAHFTMNFFFVLWTCSCHYIYLLMGHFSGKLWFYFTRFKITVFWSISFSMLILPVKSMLRVWVAKRMICAMTRGRMMPYPSARTMPRRRGRHTSRLFTT